MRKLACVLFAICLVGCSDSNNLLFGEVKAQVGGHAVRVTDCYRWTVPPPETLPDGSGYRFMPCRDADIQIRGGELTVNGRAYGKIGANASILVDRGAVSVK